MYIWMGMKILMENPVKIVTTPSPDILKPAYFITKIEEYRTSLPGVLPVCDFNAEKNYEWRLPR